MARTLSSTTRSMGAAKEAIAEVTTGQKSLALENLEKNHLGEETGRNFLGHGVPNG